MLLAVLAVAAFHAGFLYPALAWLVLVWLGCLFALRRTSCGRWAFYTGLGIGLGIYGPQLYFFWNIFGPAAVVLWLVLAFWLALFLLLLHGVDRYWGAGWAVALAPVLWLATEFFRSELYYLRFAWLTAGSVLPTLVSGPFLPWLGVYGLGAVLMGLATLGARACETAGSSGTCCRPAAIAAALGVLALFAFVWLAPRLAILKPGSGPELGGVQLESSRLAEVTEALNNAQLQWPEAAVWVLSEYSFDGPVPAEVLAWCREQQRWLVAGGKVPLDDGRFFNTAFVVSTNGEVVFKQAKSVPIQFFNDGVPAPEQRVWDSPWGRIGICICYDLSYTRVVDRLIRQGSRALIVPAMDTVVWGEHQHRLNARMTPVRAAEYRVPIFRVASSGISQLVDQQGRVKVQLPFPGQGEIIQGRLVGPHLNLARIPLDRYLAPTAVLATGFVMLALGWQQRRAHRPRSPDSQFSTPNP